MIQGINKVYTVNIEPLKCLGTTINGFPTDIPDIFSFGPLLGSRLTRELTSIHPSDQKSGDIKLIKVLMIFKTIFLTIPRGICFFLPIFNFRTAFIIISPMTGS